MIIEANASGLVTILIEYMSGTSQQQHIASTNVGWNSWKWLSEMVTQIDVDKSSEIKKDQRSVLSK